MRIASILSAALLAASALPAAAQTFTNGGFETGNFSGWTVTGGAFTGVDALSAHGGSFGAFFGESSPGSTLSQTFTTTAGQAYHVAFWLQLDDGAVPNSFAFRWNGAVQSPSYTNAAAGFDYVRITATVTATAATSTLAFTFVNPDSFWLMDDVSVTAVPEPPVWAMGAVGLLLLGARRLRRG